MKLKLNIWPLHASAISFEKISVGKMKAGEGQQRIEVRWHHQLQWMSLDTNSNLREPGMPWTHNLQSRNNERLN